MSELTLITATLGRPSLKAVYKDLSKQVRKAAWIIVGDGPEALAAAKQLIPAEPWITFVEAPKLGDHTSLLFIAMKHVKTPYVGFADDDNRFRNDHVHQLVQALRNGHRFVATLRYYADAQMNIICPEHPSSGQVDMNNMAFETKLFPAMEKFYLENDCKNATYWSDRHIVGYFLALGIVCQRIPEYTVIYKINPTRANYMGGPGMCIIETLLGRVIHVRYSKDEFEGELHVPSTGN